MSSSTPAKQPSIFISHSSKDIQVARAARNLFEDRGHHVLLLGLLQNMSDAEIFALLDDEVKARDWLILIDSENAQSSHWVQFELEKATAYQKTVYKIKCERFEAEKRYEAEKKLLPCVEGFSRSIRTVIAYSRADAHIAKAIHEHLTQHGYENSMDVLGIAAGAVDWKAQGNLREAIKWGGVIGLITQNVLKNTPAINEMRLATDLGGHIIPILLEAVDDVPQMLTKLHYLDWSKEGVTPTNLKSLTDALDQMRQSLLQEACY